VPDECAEITNNGERCGASFQYRNRLNQELKNCQEYCMTNLVPWLASVLQDLSQVEWLRFAIPEVHQECEAYVAHPLTFQVKIGAGLAPDILELTLNYNENAQVIENFVEQVQQQIELSNPPEPVAFELQIGVNITSVVPIDDSARTEEEHDAREPPVSQSMIYNEEKRDHSDEDEDPDEDMDRLNSEIGSDDVELFITDSSGPFRTSSLKQFKWTGTFGRFGYLTRFFHLTGTLE
jgi:hypothetical protein